MQRRIKVLEDQTALAREAAVEFTDVALKAVAERGVFTVALSGGSTPKVMYSLLAYDIEHGKAYYSTPGELRRAGADTLFTDPTPGKTYHVYCAFVAADRSRQSDSVYLGSITM